MRPRKRPRRECLPASVLFLPDSPIAAAVEKHPPPPPPQAFKLPKYASPPDRGGSHLDFESKDIENTNDSRGDYGCGLSGAQAAAHKAVLKPTNKGDGVTATPFIIPIRSSFCFLPLPSARPLLLVPLVPTLPNHHPVQLSAKRVGE